MFEAVFGVRGMCLRPEGGGLRPDLVGFRELDARRYFFFFLFVDFVHVLVMLGIIPLNICHRTQYQSRLFLKFLVSPRATVLFYTRPLVPIVISCFLDPIEVCHVILWWPHKLHVLIVALGLSVCPVDVA
jgi:hypothetical protein